LRSTSVTIRSPVTDVNTWVQIKPQFCLVQFEFEEKGTFQ